MQILQLHPTFNCNRNCSWCAYGVHQSSPTPQKKRLTVRQSSPTTGDYAGLTGNQNKTVSPLNGMEHASARLGRRLPFAELPLEELQQQLRYAMQTGCRIVKISGGGEPTIYSDFISLLYSARWLGFAIYIQTNGIALDQQMRDLSDDIRISYGDGIAFEIPKIQPDGFSYIISRNPDYDNMNAVIEYALGNNCYVRITQDDTELNEIPSVEEIRSHSIVAEDILIKGGTSELNRLAPKIADAIRFWDAKDFHTGINPCPCYQSPLFGADGFWYPCCKTHVAKELTQGYNETMRLGMEYPEIAYDGSDCQRCYY